MKFTQRTRGIFKTIAVVLSLALPVVIAASYADARVGGSSNSGSRGSRTFSAPPSTTTAPGTTQPMNRTMTQPGSPSAPAATGGGFFNRPGMGMLGGLAAGFLGAGLLGMLFGGGLFSGLGSFASTRLHRRASNPSAGSGTSAGRSPSRSAASAAYAAAQSAHSARCAAAAPPSSR